MNDVKMFLAYIGNTGSKTTSTSALLWGLFHRPVHSVTHSFNQILPLLCLTTSISHTFHLGQAGRQRACKQLQEKRGLCKPAIYRLLSELKSSICSEKRYDLMQKLKRYLFDLLSNLTLMSI